MATPNSRVGKDVRRPTDPVHTSSPATIASAPASVDLRTLVPAAQWPVWDQGALPSCTAHAVAGTALFELIRAGGTPLFQPSRLFLYWAERVIERDPNAAADGFVRDGVQALLDEGACADAPAAGVPAGAIWPYDPAAFATKPPATCFAFAKEHRASAASYVMEALPHLRGCLAEGHPFTICIRLFPSFDTAGATGDVPLPSAAERPDPIGGHAMSIVGYDDAKQVFLVRNSMGTQWGKGGYGTLPYAFVLDATLSDSFWTPRFAKG